MDMEIYHRLIRKKVHKSEIQEKRNLNLTMLCAPYFM